MKQRVYGRINKWLYSGFGTWILGSQGSSPGVFLTFRIPTRNFAPSHESHAHTQRCHISHDIPIVFSRGPCVFIYLSIYLSIYLIIVASTRPAFQAPFALQRTTFLHRTASRLPRDLQDIPASFAIPDISSRAMSLSSTQLHWLSLYRLDHCCGSYPKS